jgi:hypothetical protein
MNNNPNKMASARADTVGVIELKHESGMQETWVRERVERP